MTYIENVFLCMASPLLIAALCMGKRQRKFFLFCFAGMGVCLLSAYINTFFAALYKADTFAATTEIAPVVEEVMKLLPLLFYLLIFEPKAEQIKNAAVITALSFATFENICYLIHELTYRRTNRNIHVYGYQEEGTITTPFDMRVQNEIDRFHLVKNVIKYLPQLGNRGSYLVQQMNDKLVEHKQYIHEYGQDLPEVRDWKWNL